MNTEVSFFSDPWQTAAAGGSDIVAFNITTRTNSYTQDLLEFMFMSSQDSSRSHTEKIC